jgi:methionine synthase I (cobalamin-dependent)/5,10-methylenetetrahydrofolate reductase
MKQHKFLSHLEETGLPLLSDGAMGTMLNARGLGFNQCFDSLNLSEPGTVADIQRAYIEAGSDIIQTNTFSANRFKLRGYGLEEQLLEINRAGVELAQRVVMASYKEVMIAGDVGPLGVRLAPFGRIQPEEAKDAFVEQIQVLVDAGVDLLVLETFSDVHEIQQAIAAAKEVCDLPIVASMSFTRDDRTLLGDSPLQVAQALSEAGANVIGVNCSGGPAQIWRILRQMRAAIPDANGKDPYLSAMPNAGWPEQVGGRIMYPANPEYFGEYALVFCEAGARLIGGCCGTTPEHIAAMRSALDTLPQGCGPSVSELSMPRVVEEQLDGEGKPSQLAEKLSDGKFVISVEIDPPRGLSTHKLLAGASLLAEAGADVINVADSPMARMRMSPWAVCELVQRQVGVETTLHFPTRGRNLLRVQGDLLAAHALGIRNVFVVMGDPTSIGDYPEAMDNYDLVPSGLIKLIKQNFNTGLDHAGVDIGQATSFVAGCALNLAPKDPEREIRNLRRKIRAGADFALTQPVYEPHRAQEFLQRLSEEDGVLNIPILVGILPLYSARHAAFLHNEVPGIMIPEDMQQRLKTAGDRAPVEGVRLAIELIEAIKSWANGVYLIPPFSRYDMAAEIIEAC